MVSSRLRIRYGQYLSKIIDIMGTWVDPKNWDFKFSQQWSISNDISFTRAGNGNGAFEVT